MKGNKSKKILSLFLAVFMLLGTLPSAVFAGDVSGNNEGKLASLVVYTAASSTPSDSSVLLKNSTDSYTTSNVFSSDTLTYDLGSVYDKTNMIGFLATVDNGESIKVYYKDKDGNEKSLLLTSGTESRASGLIAGVNEYKIFVIPQGKEEDDATVYTVKLTCLPTLKNSLSVKAGGSTLSLTPTFSGLTTFEYDLTLPDGIEEIEFSASGKQNYYTLAYNGGSSSTVNVKDKDKVEVVVSNNSVNNTYTFNLKRKQADSVNFVVTPSDAIVSVYDQNGKSVAPNSDGTYSGLFDTYTYSYTVTKYGYVAQFGTISQNGTINVDLTKAVNSNISDVGSTWKNFRGNDSNMAIVDIQTPINASETALLWNKKFGADADWGNAPSVQIIADDSLITLVGNKIYKLDLETGEVIKSAEMSAKINWGYTPPAYAEGMIFCPLADGTIQAFNAKTLESIWIYNDNLKGQSLSPIYYSDGYIYTGFWNSETKDANYVCLSVTDEDPSKPDEAKTATWKLTHTGGFYWCGAVTAGDYVFFGSADGQASGDNGTAYLYSVNKYTGIVVSKTALSNASDVRSTIAYDEATGKIYWTSTGGYLYSAKIDKNTGAVSDLKSLNLNEPSTSTPVVYAGRIYVFTYAGFASGHLHIVSEATMQEIVSVDAGPVQSSPILSTAYENSGYLYLYATANIKKGGIDLFKVKTNAASTDDVTKIELYDADGFNEYCISSIICSADGTLYYKNDSCNVFAVGIPSYQNVIDLIDAIGTVGTDSGNAISTARGAYDALSDADKLKVSNYAKLTDAEKAYDELKVKEVVELIDAIGDNITKDSKDAINKARNAYDALTAAQKNKVPEDKKTKLENAEAALKKLTDNNPEGTTKGVSVTINGVTYVVSEATKEAMEAMQTVLDSEAPTNEDIIKAYKAYEALSYNEKLFATNYTDFETKVLAKLGEENHYDAPTKLDARDNEEATLPWYIKLVVNSIDISDDKVSKVQESLGENAQLLNLYDISFVNTLTNEEWKPTSLVKLKFPEPNTNLGSYAIVHIDENNAYGFIQPAEEENNLIIETMDFSEYGIATFEGTWNDLLGNEEIKQNAVVWPWAVGGVAGIGGILWAIFNKRKEEAEE